MNTWAAFAGSPQAEVVDGDFAMLESELQAVLKTLRAAAVNVVAIHSHMTHEEPRIMFLHYWAKGPAEELARARAGAGARVTPLRATEGELGQNSDSEAVSGGAGSREGGARHRFRTWAGGDSNSEPAD